MNSVECAYPLPEDLVVGLLYVGANTMAIAMTFVGQVILESSQDAAGPVPFYPFSWWSIGTMFLGLVPVLLYKGEYNRFDEDNNVIPYADN